MSPDSLLFQEDNVRLRKENELLREALNQTECGNKLIQQRDELSQFVQLGKAIVAELDLNKVFKLVAKKAREIIGAELMVLPVLNENRDCYSYEATSGVGSEDLLGVTFKINIGMCGWVLKNKQPLLFGENDDWWMSEKTKWEEGQQSALLVPLFGKHQIIGGLSGIGKVGGGSFTVHDLDILTMFANQVSIAIENATLFQDLTKRSHDLVASNMRLKEEIADRLKVEEALRESEAQLRTVIETIPDLIWLKDPDGIYLACNSKFELFFGAKQDEIVGKTDYDFVDKDLADFFREKDKAAMVAGRPSMNEEEITYADDGHKELLETIKTPMFDHNSKLIGVLGVGHDITDRKRMEAELLQAHKMEAIGTMAGGIAHDFNNVLAAIIGYADLAKLEIPESSPGHHQIEHVLKAGNRAKDLVSHILTFSRMSSPQQDYENIFLNSIVKEVLKFQRSIIPTTIEIRSDIDENCGQIKGDSTQIHQVIMNLCTNASHAIGEKIGILKVSLCKTELSSQDLKTEPELLPGTYVQLSVSDTGIGLTSELIEKIFDPYFTTKEVGKGSGMGLAVAQSIVKNHEGFVKVESEIGKGCTFNVFFPEAKEKITEKDIDEAGDIPTGTESILFVDDEEILVDIGKSILERLGYSVTTKTNSAEALDLFRSDPGQFDLVITDQTMPNIPGSELAKYLLQIRPDIPIILCTGYSTSIDEDQAGKIGVRGYAMKPVSINVISRLIRNVLDGNVSASLQT
jgi:PAS domain S-box-containing protein